MDFEEILKITSSPIRAALEIIYNFWKCNKDIERIVELRCRIADTDAEWKNGKLPFNERFIKETGLQMIGGCANVVLSKGTQEEIQQFGPEILAECHIWLQILGCYMNMLDFGLGYMPWLEWNARYRAYLEEIDYQQRMIAASLACEKFDFWDELLPEEW